ncbi:hypothetical protein FLJC2902T_31850 [Flavobacterium limnosediminis JC2902]|uniref:Imm33-like domain-containing protein n=1 Tax=Flavobacterium limnosediminis JC2902 TaxID=1341181 RepID=V6SDC2_9FLAO|nr:hypothetical protein [Flavobacterium limnosediminis]ESU24653.1 hypothetical protein FLJC2902T_31850 [Flavobacterium limnosediminis JC2902]
MSLERKQLIDLCDKYLNDEIDANDLSVFAFKIIMSDDDDWDDADNIISKTLFEWNNEDINFPINKINIKLWKNRLENNIDELKEYNFWNSHIEKQKEICEKYNSKWKPISKNLKIGVSENLDLEPINGLRHKTEKGEVCWFIWGGEYSEDENFFKPMCAEHLLQRKPKVVDYLGLDEGFRFLINGKGYEDVWFDEKLLEK